MEGIGRWKSQGKLYKNNTHVRSSVKNNNKNNKE